MTMGLGGVVTMEGLEINCVGNCGGIISTGGGMKDGMPAGIDAFMRRESARFAPCEVLIDEVEVPLDCTFSENGVKSADSVLQ